MNRSGEGCESNEQLRSVVKRVAESAVGDAHPGPADARELEPHEETGCPVGVFAEENEGRVEQGRDKRSYDDEIAVRHLPLQDASAVGERKPIVDGSETPPGEQQMSERRYDQQESHRSKDISTIGFD